MNIDTKKIIADMITIEGESAQSIYDALGVPPDESMGDFALPCFPYAKKLRKSPVKIAEELQQALQS